MSCKGKELLRGGKILKKRQDCQSESILLRGWQPPVGCFGSCLVLLISLSGPPCSRGQPWNNLSNPVSPTFLSMSSVASSALGVQHFPSQKCSELNHELLRSELTGLFFPLFSKHCHEERAVQYRKAKKQETMDLYRVCKIHE